MTRSRWHPSRSVLIFEVVALPSVVLAGIALAGEARWDIPLLALLLAFAVLSDLTAATVTRQRIKISGSFLSIVVAIVLLGGVPAALLGIVTILVGWFRWRENAHRLLANVIFYAAFPLLSGALFHIAGDLLGATPGESVFYLLVFAGFALALALDFLMVAGYLRYLGEASVGESARTMLVPLLPSHLAGALLAGGVAYLYHYLGLAAIPLIGIVLLTFQYLMSELLKSQQRAAALERQTEELRSSRQSLAAFVSAAPIVLWAIDREGSFLLVEGEQRELLGLGESRVSGASLFELEGQAPEIVDGARQALEGASADRIVEAGGLTFEARLSPLWMGGAQVVGVIGVAIDVSARVKAQRENEKLGDRLNQAQRLESVGHLAGGIAHDFNNLLGVILAYTSFVLDEIGETSPMREDVQEIYRAADQAADLTRDLLLFSRQQPSTRKPIDLNETVTRTTRLLRRTLGERVELRTALAPGLWTIMGDQGQTEQVLMNLAVNARDAMPDGGRLTFTTENCSLSQRDAASRGDLTSGDYVRLTVADTGTGMTDEVQSRIFDPFFTTKEAGHGTGLGLATVYGIVGKGGGHIAVSSELGEGTAFEVLWPAAAQAEHAESNGAEAASRPGSGETVLVAEDEEGLRRSTARILDSNGYRVIAVDGGQAALEELLRSVCPVDLLLTDVVMPDMSGPQLIERARTLRPTLRVLLMSGYGHDAMGSANAAAVAPTLKKPFGAATLLAQVREVLSFEPAPASVERARGGR